MIAAGLIEAAKTGNTAQSQKHDLRWTANADAIADFLSGASPHWPRNEV